MPGRASAGYAQQSDPKQVRHFYQETSPIFAGDEFENAEAHAENNAAASGELLRLFLVPQGLAKLLWIRLWDHALTRGKAQAPQK